MLFFYIDLYFGLDIFRKDLNDDTAIGFYFICQTIIIAGMDVNISLKTAYAIGTDEQESSAKRCI